MSAAANKNDRDDWTVKKSILSIKFSASSGFQIVMGGYGSPQACSDRQIRSCQFLNSPNSFNLLKYFQSFTGVDHLTVTDYFHVSSIRQCCPNLPDHITTWGGYTNFQVSHGGSNLVDLKLEVLGICALNKRFSCFL